MAERTASLIIKLKDLASTPLKGVVDGIGKLKTGYLAVAAAVAGAVKIGYEAIQAYMESERAVVKLESALRSQGLEVAGASAEAQRYATQLQLLTGISDETIIESQALLTTFGLTGKAMLDATAAAADLSARFDIDMKSASLAVGKAFQGQTMSLERLVGKIGEGVPVSERFAAVMGLVEKRAGGAAEALGATLSGRMSILKERVGELQEDLGRLLLPAFELAIDYASRFVGGLETLVGWFTNGKQGALEFAMAMMEGSKLILEGFIAAFTPLFEILAKFGLDMNAVTLGVNAAIDRQIAKVAQMAMASNTAVTNRVNFEKNAVTAQSAFMDEARAKELKKQDEYYAGIKERVDKHFEDEMKARIRDVELQEMVNKQKTADLQSTLSTISTMSQAHNKTIAAVGKAAAIADATMSMYQGIMKAWALGPIVGPPLAALVGAAGAFNIAKIGGVQLAEGGIVMPRPGGTTATIGEAGSAEAVIPLDDDRAMGMLGGGGHEIHIHAGTIIADRTSIREFATLIDRALYDLERNRLSVRS